VTGLSKHWGRRLRTDAKKIAMAKSIKATFRAVKARAVNGVGRFGLAEASSLTWGDVHFHQQATITFRPRPRQGFGCRSIPNSDRCWRNGSDAKRRTRFRFPSFVYCWSRQRRKKLAIFEFLFNT
jgi:hypothetical protein